MPEFTPRLRIPYPSEFDDPWIAGFRNYATQVDSVLHALSENDNLRYIGGGNFSWTTATNILSWTEDINVRSFTTPYGGVIPAQSFELEEGDILFFQMFRMLTGNFTVSMVKGKVTTFDPVRNPDLVVFAFRADDVIYMPGQNSIISGDFGPLFGSGLSSGAGTPSDHVHLPELLIEPGALAVSVLSLPITSPVLLQVRLYRNGLRQAQGATEDYTLNLGAGEITLNLPTQELDERFIVDMIRTP